MAKKQEKIADVILYDKNTKGVNIISAEKWYTRIWYYVSNPFTYLFKGNVRW